MMKLPCNVLKVQDVRIAKTTTAAAAEVSELFRHSAVERNVGAGPIHQGGDG